MRTKRSVWIPAKVGCHWDHGPFRISTYQSGAESGYVLYAHRDCIGHYRSFQSARRAALRIKMQMITSLTWDEVTP